MKCSKPVRQGSFRVSRTWGAVAGTPAHHAVVTASDRIAAIRIPGTGPHGDPSDPRMRRMLCRCVTFLGALLSRSSQFLNSRFVTECVTGTATTVTSTLFSPSAVSPAHSSLRIAARQSHRLVKGRGCDPCVRYAFRVAHGDPA
jgi:hypothetical protein